MVVYVVPVRSPPQVPPIVTPYPVFEVTVLGAALAAFFGFIALNGLPRLRHPMFDAPDFNLASRNRFFLCVRASGEPFDAEGVERFLSELDPVRVSRVAP